MPTTIVTDEQIRETAYLFWLDDGQPVGRDEEHWLRAVDALTKPIAKPKAPRKAATKPAAKRSVKSKVKAAKA